MIIRCSWLATGHLDSSEILYLANALSMRLKCGLLTVSTQMVKISSRFECKLGHATLCHVHSQSSNAILTL